MGTGTGQDQTISDGELADVESIRALKHAYFRFLDGKSFGELGELLTEDVTTGYQSGELSQHGRSEVVAFLEQSLGDASVVTMHTGHHPEIRLTSPTTAEGNWYLEDRVVVPARDFDLRGTAIYSDRYRKDGGTWRICHTGYNRIFEERRKLSTGELISFTSRFDAKS